MADNTIFDEWLEIAQNFKDKADAMLNEIRQYKQDMFLMRNEMMERLEAGQFIRDNSRIVISAPEIIIGNVDHHGVLQGGGTVIIKGATVENHGVGEGGQVNIVAPLIQQIAPLVGSKRGTCIPSTAALSVPPPPGPDTSASTLPRQRPPRGSPRSGTPERRWWWCGDPCRESRLHP